MAEEQLIVCLADNKNFYFRKDKVLADSWPFDCGGCISGSCDECVLQTKPMTRTEAIERMARELCENVYGSFWENASEQEKQNCLIYAEAALDALITEVK